MPVILAPIADPTDLVVQGEEMRHAALAGNLYPPMHPDFTPYDAKVRSVSDGNFVAANALIASQCGELTPVFGVMMLNTFVQSTARFQIAGTTRDSTGAALGNCRVVALETGRLAVTGSPIVGETISDGSGAYAIPTTGNTAHEVIAYLPGSPDRAGISLNTVIPAAV